MTSVGVRPVLVVISEDPRVSPRASEALRIALGVAAGDTPLRIALLGGAARLLEGDTDDLVDGDDIARFRSGLRGLEVPLHVEADAIPADPAWNPDGFPIVPITTADLGALISSCGRFLVF
jgi:hypothetical protein